MNTRNIFFGAVTSLSIGACAGGTTNPDDFGYAGTGVAFQVAPLTLDSVSDACYSFTVVNEADELVVGRGPEAAARWEFAGANANSVCASQFGNGAGGDASYVAPCDAQQPRHTVTLWVDAICDGDSPAADPSGTPDSQLQAEGGICDQIQAYTDPCADGCEVSVECVENADTPVTFNLTIMGQADQGFFDIAVNFDDVFCSAKLDDCDTSGDKIDLVFDPATGQRMNTIVAAVSCTAGPDSEALDVNTHLNLAPLSISCLDGETPVEGTLDFAGLAQEGNVAIGEFPGAIYFGTEALAGVNKVYTNVAIGVGDLSGCALSWDVIPSNKNLQLDNAQGVFNSYGYVQFDASDLGGEACSVNPLNGEGSGVTTQYATDVAPAARPTAQLVQGREGYDPFGG